MKPSFEQLELFERWLPVAGYEGLYEVSNWGRVRSLARATTAGRLLVPSLRRDGYLTVGVSKKGHPKSIAIHRSVAEAFLGICPLGRHVDHIDGNRENNTLPNLRYVTRAENQNWMRDRLGRWPRGKLNKSKAIEIRRLSLEGMPTMQIAALFAIGRTSVRRIVRNETWKVERNA